MLPLCERDQSDLEQQRKLYRVESVTKYKRNASSRYLCMCVALAATLYSSICLCPMHAPHVWCCAWYHLCSPLRSAYVESACSASNRLLQANCYAAFAMRSTSLLIMSNSNNNEKNLPNQIPFDIRHKKKTKPFFLAILYEDFLHFICHEVLCIQQIRNWHIFLL